MKIKEKDLKILFDERMIQERITQMGAELNDFYGNAEICVISVLKGSVMFTVDLVKHLKMPLRMEFIRLMSYGNAQASSGSVKAVDISLPDLNDRHVLIVEDIIDTGLTAQFLLNFIKLNFKTKSTKFCSLLNKTVSRKVDVEPDYYGFEIDDKFVIGYGLDYEGLYRNLKYIGYVET